MPEAERACAALVDAASVMNQIVRPARRHETPHLEALFRAWCAGAAPYYLLMADPVRGTGHLRTPLETGLSLMEALQGRLSGIALPKLIVDTPGGMGKVPVGPEWIVARSPGRTVLRTHRGVTVEYLDPPG